MNPTGGNPIVAHLLALGRPVTAESYLAFAYPDPLPDPLPAEIQLEAEEAVAEAALRNSARRTLSETLYPPPQPEQVMVGPGPLGVDVPPDSSPETKYQAGTPTAPR